LLSEIRRYLYLPDPSPLLVTLGAVAANRLPGNPVWLILVGPSACGKTQMLELLAGLPSARIVSTIASPAALLSGTFRKDAPPGGSGGLLRELGLNGILLMTDMAGMLALPAISLQQVLAAFRDIYGGRWVRPIAGGGGRRLIWGPQKAGEPFGHLTFLGAATPAIDRHQRLNRELGERWLYFRFPASDSLGETARALQNKDPLEVNRILRGRVAGFFRTLAPRPKRDWTPTEERRFTAMASLSVRLRSPVRHSLEGVAEAMEAERPQRLATVLGQLALGLEAIGLGEAERWPLVAKVALDSTPRLAAELVRVLHQLTPPAEVLGLRDLAFHLKQWGRSQFLVQRIVEDLQIHGVVEVFRSGRPPKSITMDHAVETGGPELSVGLSPFTRHCLEQGWDWTAS